MTKKGWKFEIDPPKGKKVPPGRYMVIPFVEPFIICLGKSRYQLLLSQNREAVNGLQFLIFDFQVCPLSLAGPEGQHINQKQFILRK